MNIILLASEIAEHEILFRKIQNATAANMGLWLGECGTKKYVYQFYAHSV
jgi:hypothetical protein